MSRVFSKGPAPGKAPLKAALKVDELETAPPTVQSGVSRGGKNVCNGRRFRLGRILSRYRYV